METYCYDKGWRDVLPDGKAFCSWGGLDFSRELIRLMSVNPADVVVDLCCGYGGTFALFTDTLMPISISWIYFRVKFEFALEVPSI